MPHELIVKRIKVLSFFKLCLVGNTVSFVLVWILISIPALLGSPLVKWEDEYITGAMTVVAGPLVVVALGLMFSIIQALFVCVGLLLYSNFAKIRLTFLAENQVAAARAEFAVRGLTSFSSSTLQDNIMILETSRLLLRQWRDTDAQHFAQLNADPAVMEFFPATLSAAESNFHMQRLSTAITERGWGLWAAELKATREFIGFTGLNIPFFFRAAILSLHRNWLAPREEILG